MPTYFPFHRWYITFKILHHLAKIQEEILPCFRFQPPSKLFRIYVTFKNLTKCQDIENEGPGKKGGIRRKGGWGFDGLSSPTQMPSSAKAHPFFSFPFHRISQEGSYKEAWDIWASWIDQRNFRWIEVKKWPESFEGQSRQESSVRHSWNSSCY